MADIEDFFSFEFNVPPTAHGPQTDSRSEDSSGDDYSPDDSSDGDYSPSDDSDDEYATSSRATAAASSTAEFSDAPETTSLPLSDGRPRKASSIRNPRRLSPSRNKKKRRANDPNTLNNSEKSSVLTKVKIVEYPPAIINAVFMCTSRQARGKRGTLPLPKIHLPDLDLDAIKKQEQEQEISPLYPEGGITRLTISILQWISHYYVGRTRLGPLLGLESSISLAWYQTRDTIRILIHYGRRYFLRVTGHQGAANSMEQGHLLQYEMGLGKTLVACAVICYSRMLENEINRKYDIAPRSKQIDLIIAPLSVHSHWVEHLTRLSGGWLKVAVWQGEQVDPANIDVLIITIETLRTQYSRFLLFRIGFAMKIKAEVKTEEDYLLAELGWQRFAERSKELRSDAFLMVEHFRSVTIVQLNEEEQMVYDKINSAKMATVLRVLRLRQTCLHPSLVAEALEKIKSVKADVGYTGVAGDESDKFHYQIVVDIPPGFQISCNVAIWKEVKVGKGEGEDLQRWERQKLAEVCSDRYISSKFKAVFAILKRVPRGEKTLIFSMFPSLLDVLGSFLENNGIEYVQYDGRMNPRERDDALIVISDDKECNVMLISMKAGGVGLNIMACNHVIVFDPWWNPYVEEQAIARAYRRGQTREVHVYRILCPKTIEDWISKVQEKKRIAIDAFTEECAMATHFQDVNEPLN
ncbi:hypothetical protein H1R20_g8520, partial [Candolleomyces eurysporus]